VVRKFLSIAAIALVAAALLMLSQRWREDRSPSAWTHGNILPNADWSLPADDDTSTPSGWRTSGTVQRSTAATGYVLEGAYSLRLVGSNSVARSPSIKASPGQRFRLGFRALVDPGTQTGQYPTQLQVWVHWVDAAGDDIRLDKQPPLAIGYAADGTPTWTPVLVETEPAPDSADQIAISLHSLADERLFIDDLQLNAAGLYVAPWPDGATAAVSFSVDWETAMGGSIHSRTAAITEAETTGLLARTGTTNLLALYQAAGVRGTWFGNGYNFLNGNPERRTWMGDPTFGWATSANGWRTDWSHRPWFGDDRYGTVASDPAWYFGDLIAPLKADAQPIESHTFSHLYVGFSRLAEWQADLGAWREVAAEQAVAPASALAFPWGSTAGMSNAHWQALEDAGIRSVTRTRLPNDLNTLDDRYLLINRNLYQPRMLPGHAVLAFPDFGLLPATQAEVLQRLAAAIAAGGVIDIWAHTNEIVTPEQIDAWRTAITAAAGNPAAWVAPLPDIAAYWRGVREVRAEILDAAGPLRIRITNQGTSDLRGVMVRLPGVAERAEGPVPIAISQDQLRVDLPAGASVELQVWLAPAN
jgi:hypothetical protein